MKSTLKFRDLSKMDYIMLYAGDIPLALDEYNCKGMIGLSLHASDNRHIRYDITKPYPIAAGTIDAYQAEDVFEHIEYDLLVNVINEIYRILKKGGYFRLSVPDYRCDIYVNRSGKDVEGNIVFDPQGGGGYIDNKVVNGGHVWFPTYEKVLSLIEKSLFERYTFYHYYDIDGKSITKPIDYSKGFVQRTPDHDDRVRDPYRAMSIVVDMFK